MKIIEITNQNGSISEYTIRKLSPIEGREIILGYLASMLPLKNKYPFNEKLMRELIAHVSVEVSEVNVMLKSDALIAKYVSDWRSLATLEYEMLKYNCMYLSDYYEMQLLVDRLEALVKSFIMAAIPK